MASRPTIWFPNGMAEPEAVCFCVFFVRAEAHNRGSSFTCNKCDFRKLGTSPTDDADHIWDVSIVSCLFSRFPFVFCEKLKDLSKDLSPLLELELG